MPTYTFHCEPCDHDQDFIARMNDAPKLKPNCQGCGEPMTRVLKPPRVKQDTFDEPLHLYNMKPVYGNGPKNPKTGKPMYDVVNSDSELKKWRYDYQDKHDVKIQPTFTD